MKLKLENGAIYSHTGKLAFAEANVSQTTGTFTVRAEFPNPDRLLLPGMYVRAIIEEGVAENSFLAPQRAVTRNTKGEATALFVTPEGKVEQRVLAVDRSVGNNWLVSSGVKDGDRIIVEGTQLVRPGQDVTAVEVTIDDTTGEIRGRKQGSLPQPGATQSAQGDSELAARLAGEELADVALLHRPADLRLGDRHRHHARRRCWRSRRCRSRSIRTIAPPPVRDQRHLSRRRRPDGRELGDPDHRAEHDRASTISSTWRRPATSTGSVADHADLRRRGTNPDIAQVQVQNKLQLATPLLPQTVQQQGITVTKSATELPDGGRLRLRQTAS